MKQEYSIRNSRDKLRSYRTTTKNHIEHKLAEYVAGLSNLKLYPQIEYAVLSEGKRLRPFLVILSAESVGGNRARVMNLALAFELMHTASLVHDDIIDQDESRRDKLAIHKKWSINDAILTGDALIALAVHLASSYGEQVLHIVAQSALELCDGEKMDVTFSLENATQEAYFTRITQKSASLFRASTQCGAIAGGGTSPEAQALASFGENFGVAYQLKDDLSDLTNEGISPLKDLRAGRITLPLIHCYNNANSRNQEHIDSSIQILMNEKHGDKDKAATSLFTMLQNAGSFSYCEQKIGDRLHKAIKSISILKDTEYKAHLIEMTKALKAWS